ncbi:hypothetical protein VTI74DRAFT_7088 [Chaetomium olivicolor]
MRVWVVQAGIEGHGSVPSVAPYRFNLHQTRPTLRSPGCHATARPGDRNEFDFCRYPLRVLVFSCPLLFCSLCYGGWNCGEAPGKIRSVLNIARARRITSSTGNPPCLSSNFPHGHLPYPLPLLPTLTSVHGCRAHNPHPPQGARPNTTGTRAQLRSIPERILCQTIHSCSFSSRKSVTSKYLNPPTPPFESRPLG